MVSVNTHKNGVNPWWDVRCTSTDSKPTAGVPNGSTCIEIDTGDGYLFNADVGEWVKQEGSTVIVIPSAAGVSF